MHALGLLILAGQVLVSHVGMADDRPSVGLPAFSISSDLGPRPDQVRRDGPQSFPAHQIAQCCKICRKGTHPSAGLKSLCRSPPICGGGLESPGSGRGFSFELNRLARSRCRVSRLWREISNKRPALLRA